MNVGDPVVTALETERQLFVVDAQGVHDCRVLVVNVDRILDDVVAVVVRLAVAETTLDAAAGHPDAEVASVMIASVIVLLDLALAIDRAAKFTAPNHQRVVEKAACFQILHERGAGLIRVLALFADALGQAAVLVPAAVVKLDETHTALGHAAGEQAIGGERAGLLHVGPVKVEHTLRLLRDVHQLRHGRLHAEGHFVLRNAGVDFGIGEGLVLLRVELGEAVEHAAPRVGVDAGRVVEEQHRVAAAAKLDALMFGRHEARAPQPLIQRLVALLAAGDHDNERGKILVGRAQTVTQPRADARTARLLKTGLNERDRRVVLVVIALANIALPLTNAFAGEFMMFSGLFKFNIWVTAAAGVSIILAAVYTLNMVQKVFYGETNAVTESIKDISLNQKIVLAVIVVFIFVLGVFPQPVFDLTKDSVTVILGRFK